MLKKIKKSYFITFFNKSKTTQLDIKSIFGQFLLKLNMSKGLFP